MSFVLSFVFSYFYFNFFNKLRFYLVFNLCLSELLPTNYKCSAKIYNDDYAQQQLDVKFANLTSYGKCERVDPAKKRMLREKFEIAESYLGRLIGNILKHFTDERVVEGVRRLDLTLLCSV